jgi:hypothetical protein
VIKGLKDEYIININIVQLVGNEICVYRFSSTHSLYFLGRTVPSVWLTCRESGSEFIKVLDCEQDNCLLYPAGMLVGVLLSTTMSGMVIQFNKLTAP